MNYIVETKNLKKHFGNIKAVNGINLKIREGIIFGLLGPNGAGKTTTIKMLITLLAPTGGEAFVCNFDIDKEPEKVRFGIGYVTQETALDKTLTGRENLLLWGNLYHLSADTLRKRVDEVLNLVELTDRADSQVKTYSGGMKKRLDIASGLLHSPRLLFLDEPTLGLDIQTRRRIWDYIRDLKEKGMTIIITTHYLEEADNLCDEVAIIDYGEIKKSGSPSELKIEMGEQMIQLKFSSCNDKAIKELTEKINSFTCIKNILLTKEGMNIYTSYSDDLLLKIPQLAREASLHVESLTFSKPSLDDLFLNITGHKIRDES